MQGKRTRKKFVPKRQRKEIEKNMVSSEKELGEKKKLQAVPTTHGPSLPVRPIPKS